MKIAFDAKRVYENSTGLGHYGRTLVSSLARFHPSHHYFLCAPKVTSKFDASAYSNVHVVQPESFLSATFPALWRSNRVKYDLKKLGVDIYHGLSHEIPVGIRATGIKSVVTIHDLIFERYPRQYNRVDVQIYRRKFKYACKHSDVIIAISQQTKADIMHFYGIPPEKITVCYQSCNPAFAKEVSNEEKLRIKELYQLPERFFLYVGSIIERKNLLTICKALKIVKQRVSIPLVVIGDGGSYAKQVREFVTANGLENDVIFLADRPAAQFASYKNATDFPAIYQQAVCMIYPSLFEGFGIPVLEALWSNLPVITSNISCMPETGGDAALYVNPLDAGEMAKAMNDIATNETLAAEMKEKGLVHAHNFTPAKCAADVLDVYLRLV